MTGSTILLERRGHVATVTLNRPDAMNALNPRLVIELAECWKALAGDHDVRVVVVTGAGDRAFCAGADLKQLIPLHTRQRAPVDEWDHRVLDEPYLLDIALLRGFDLGKPVIAAIQGAAIGGGAELVQCCDLRVMANDATVALKEVQWGLFPSGGSSVLLPRQLPWAIAVEMLLTGRPMTAQEAIGHGFVNLVTPREETCAAAQTLADSIAALAPLAVQAIRRSLREARSTSIELGLARELELAMPVFASRDAAEGLAAFAEKRPAIFTGE